jgi:hypothetical protein
LIRARQATADPTGLPWASPVWYAAGSDLRAPARHRLYHATAIQHFVLSSTDEPLPVDIA